MLSSGFTSGNELLICENSYKNKDFCLPEYSLQALTFYFTFRPVFMVSIT